ncbi:hypothetical protein ACDX78_10380 [Virgibacillus oceani]
MQSVTEIGNKMKESETRARKGFLINQLNKMGIYQLEDGRKVDDGLSLYTLEWSHIQEKSKAAKAYGESP